VNDGPLDEPEMLRCPSCKQMLPSALFMSRETRDRNGKPRTPRRVKQCADCRDADIARKRPGESGCMQVWPHIPMPSYLSGLDASSRALTRPWLMPRCGLLATTHAGY
jgi:hypothetical protein